MIPSPVASVTPSAPTDDAPWWREPSPSASAAAIFVLAILAYANTFGHGFVWDDPVLLEQKVRFYRGPLDAFFEPAGSAQHADVSAARALEPLDRPRLWTSGTGFHVTQVLLHAVNGALVVLLARALGTAPWAALVGAALFALHPVQVESVAWLTCRADVMTATFAVIAMLAFLRHQDRPAWWTVGVIAIAGFLATASKETGSVTPLLLLAALATLPRPPDAFTTRLRRAWPALVAAVVGVGLCQALRPADVTTGIGRAALGAQDVTEPRSARSAISWRACSPLSASRPTSRRRRPIVGHLALAVGGGAVLLAGTRRPRARRRRPPARHPVVPPRGGAGGRGRARRFLSHARRRAAPLPRHGRRRPRRRDPARHATVPAPGPRPASPRSRAVLVACAVVTVVRNGYWRDELTLWTRGHRTRAGRVAAASEPRPRPRRRRPQCGGRGRVSPGAHPRPDGASPASGPTSTSVWSSSSAGPSTKRRRLFTAANAIAPHATAFRGLGMIARKREQERDCRRRPRHADAELNRAHALLQRALAINPRYHQAHVTLGGVLYAAGQYRAALARVSARARPRGRHRRRAASPRRPPRQLSGLARDRIPRRRDEPRHRPRASLAAVGGHARRQTWFRSISSFGCGLK